MARESFSEQLWNGLGDAIADIRQKVVEEPMWGRAVTNGPERLQWPEPQEPEPSFGSSTHIRDVGPTHGQMQENANYRLAAMEREQEQDIDR
jgi:hypothetical protein